MSVKREFLRLAHTYKEAKHGIGGYWWSEKLDGMRCFWDGGATRGLPKADVPWANTNKDSRYVDPPIATGLWSRYGNVLHAPDKWLNELPPIPLDGELYNPELLRQDLLSIVKKLTPDPFMWGKVGYHVFSSPPPEIVLADGPVRYGPDYVHEFEDCWDWWQERTQCEWFAKPSTSLKSQYFMINKHAPSSRVLNYVPQIELPCATDRAIFGAETALATIADRGGEGIMVVNPNMPYECKRSHFMLKMKKFDDAEGRVIGWVSGRETDKGSKLMGLMGALILDIGGGKVMEISGFTDSERRLEGQSYDWAMGSPGEQAPNELETTHFPKGKIITFKYRGKSRDGIPNEARYWRDHAAI